jgi:hypothetical protein
MRAVRCTRVRGLGVDAEQLQSWTSGVYRNAATRRSGRSDAPIAPAYFPYNRCDLWQCRACPRAYLRYTEYGGYYEDERIRALDPALVDDTPA